MYYSFFLILIQVWSSSFGQEVYETDMNFRVEPGAKVCFFEKGETGQMMEAKYQVIDGQHGDYDITFTVLAPSGQYLVNDHKSSHNSIIMDLEESGDYLFCLDNEHSMMNSKLVFVYVLIENKQNHNATEENTHVAQESETTEEVIEWTGTDENGTEYYVAVETIADSLTRTLRHVVKARHALNMYGALKSRDSYLAFEDTFIVDLWSAFQISFMFLVGMLQVYMIKKLFNRTIDKSPGYY